MTTKPIQHIPPAAMSAAQRREEVARLLTHALVRLRTGGPGLTLGFSGHQRVHTNPQAKEVDA